MTREDRALTLLASANPVPDARVFERGEARRVHLDDVEQWSDEMTDTKLREIETGGGRQRPPWLMGALAALLVVVVGLAALFIMRDEGDEPDVATTVTTAAATDPTFTLDGTTCEYDGPTRFALGAAREFTVVNNASGQAFVRVYPVAPGTQLPAPGEEFPEFASFMFLETDLLESGDVVTFNGAPEAPVPDIEGLWFAECVDLAADMHHAVALIEVVP